MRLFIACPIPDSLKKSIEKIESLFKESEADVKWIKPENLHITLKFLGKVDKERLNDVIEKTRNAINGVSSIYANVESLGVFPNWRKPRVVWIGIEQGKEELKRLSNNVDEKLSLVGFEKEKREFAAHLTIGRVRSNKNIKKLIDVLQKKSKETFGEIFIDHIVLMESKLSSQGASYACIEKFSLK